MTSGSEGVKKAMQYILSDSLICFSSEFTSDRFMTKKKIYIYFFLHWAVNTQVLALN